MILRQILKDTGAFCGAFAILTLLFTFYGLIPVHIDNPNGNTDYIWPPNAKWMKMTEGVSWGRLDAKGFNNKTVIDNPDILLVGSSHMEAMNIMQDDTIASQLNQRLNGRFNVYNLGISGHNFFKTCQYLPRNIEIYKPRGLKAIIIETSSIDVRQKDIDAILNQGVKKTSSHAEGIVGKLQRNPFLRTLYFQYEHGLAKTLSPPQVYHILKNRKGKKTKIQLNENQDMSKAQVVETACSRLMSWLATLQKEHHVRIIIFYHPFEELKRDGSISFGDMDKTLKFKKVSVEHGVTFIDMSNPFIQMYQEEHHVPHGFATGKLGVGHLNAFGQAVVAKELAKVIENIDKEVGLLP